MHTPGLQPDRTTASRPSFVIGITGHVDPDDCNKVREDLANLFRFLKHGAVTEKAFLERLPHPQHAPGLDEWPGLIETPITVLTSLAPGADTLAAEVALLPEFVRLGFRLLAPLPFPARFYVHSSSFVKRRGGVVDAHRGAQERFCRLARELGPDWCFPVWLEEDLPFSESDRLRRAAADCRDKDSTRRHRRYQAAGEYIATHCDLLVALWDDDHATGKAEGTEGIVRVKMRGVTVGLRAMVNAVNWADCGSVVHLYMHRRVNAKPADPAKPGKMRWLHSADLAKAEFHRMPALPGSADPLLDTWFLESKGRCWREDYEEWQTTGNQLLCRMAVNLNRFNEEWPKTTDGLEDITKYFQEAENPAASQQPLYDSLAQQAPDFLSNLQMLFASRRHAANRSAGLRPKSKKTLIWGTWLVFLFAVCVDIAGHWHSQGASHHAAHGIEPVEITLTHGDAVWWIEAIAGFLALLCAVQSLRHFRSHAQDGVEEHDQDYRALAEGLRVQIAWCAAGLSHAAAGNYLQRQRNEMDWLRTALSSLHMPSGRWKAWFDALDADLRLRLLTQVASLWVDSEAKYFETSGKKQHSEMHGWHKIGSVLALAGAFLVLSFVVLAGLKIGGVVDETGRLLRWRGLYKIADWIAVFGLLVFAGVVAQYASLWKAAYLKHRFNTDEKVKKIRRSGYSDWLQLIQLTLGNRSGGNPHEITWEKWGKSLRASWFTALTKLISLAIPSLHRPVHQTMKERGRQMDGNAARHFGVGAIVSVFIFCWAIWLTRHFDFLPSIFNLELIISGVSLVAGALVIAWAEKNLLSEHAYQYGAMASFFAAAKERLDAYLTLAEAARETDWATARRNHPNIVPPPTPSASPEVDRYIREAQALIYDVGKEALSENGEWLILHRSRPMEPVMPG